MTSPGQTVRHRFWDQRGRVVSIGWDNEGGNFVLLVALMEDAVRNPVDEVGQLVCWSHAACVLEGI